MNYSTKQLSALVLLRFAIGWHFAYEGIIKLMNPSWDAAMYLRDSQGIFSGLFNSLASSSAAMDCINLLNEWGLLLIGLALITGTLARIASWCGIVMLFVYYLSHPAGIGLQYAMPMEGSYLWIDKNIIEILALFVLIALPTSQIIGIDRFLKRFIPKAI